MKHRLRSIESKETLRIEAPNPCSLRQLKQIISQNLPSSPPTDLIRLSLNRKDELESISPDGEISLLGITSGDLIFFNLDSNSVQNSTPDSLNSNTQNALSEAQSSGSAILDGLKKKTLDTDVQMEETRDLMEVCDEIDDNSNSNDGVLAEVVEDSLSVPGFLRKVCMEVLGDDSGLHHKLTVTAIHAVLLESGFVGFDLNSNTAIQAFHLTNEWPSGGFRLSLFYTLPAIVGVSQCDPIDSVVLKFQSLGKFLSVYGSLNNGSGGTQTHSVRLNEDQLVPFFNVIWANCGVTEIISSKDGAILGASPEKQVFNFWRTVKDNLALPLLIDLCEKAGLQLPPCFTRLPTDLKMKILESLPGVEVAKVSCVCSELQYLASNDDLWKMKFKEQFGDEKTDGHGSWKREFSRAWERQKNRNLESRARTALGWPAPRRMPRHDRPFIIGPRIIGGNHDIFPAFGGGFNIRLHGLGNHVRRNFSPHCDLE